MILALCGCATFPGSLATDSGPNPAGWSEQDQQLVHVGERVNFSFVMARDFRKKQAVDPVGLVDYCIGRVGSELIEATLLPTGHYRFSYDLTGRRPGEVIDVSAVAYRIRGMRDIMKIGDRWVRADAPSDEADRIVSRDSLRMTVYKSRIELPCQWPGHDLDMATGRLELRRADGSVTRVLARQGGGERQVGGKWFTWSGPDAAGRYMVIYEPEAAELNKFGTTPVRFIVYDVAGNRQVFDATLSTP